jgi:hypothetical protein
MKSFAPVAIAAAAAVLASGLTLSATAQPSPKPSPACFWQRSITNFAANDTSRVYLRVGGNQVFELTLFANCLQLNWVHRLAIRSRGSSNVCEGPNPGLDVIVRDSGGIPGGQRCPVTGVRKLTPDEVAALPPQARP